MGAAEKRVKPKTLRKSLAPIWDEIAGGYPASSDLELEALCGLVFRLRQARERIDEEGLLVKGKDGNAIPHPALETERQMVRELRAWEGSPGAKQAAQARRSAARPVRG